MKTFNKVKTKPKDLMFYSKRFERQHKQERMIYIACSLFIVTVFVIVFIIKI